VLPHLFASTEHYRASLIYFEKDLKLKTINDGLLSVTDGKFSNIETFDSRKHSKLSITHFKGKIISAGFIDTHIHYPQTEMIASYGEQLLEWLKSYTFPTERLFQDPKHASRVSKIFVKELLRNGTTTALVFATVHPESVKALFMEAEHLGMRIIAGKVLMDRNAPEYLLDSPERALQESSRLIKDWHQKPGTRIEYAVTPRFAPTSTESQLETAKTLLIQHQTVRLHTHLSENKDELAWVRSLYPKRKNYFDVYQHYGLTGPRSIFAHSIHLSPDEWDEVSKTDSRIAFCPASNLFLGSGLFDYKTAKQKNIKVGIGSDVGAGTTFSILQNLNEAYKIQQLQNQKLGPAEAFYLATLGGATVLGLENRVGNLKIGNEADFVVLDPEATPIMKVRAKNSTTLEDKLFALMMLGDDRSITSTFLLGKQSFKR